MKELPDVTPEIRALLEEIVADPRSSMRLAPRRTSTSWFDRGESLRPREVSATRAERHLVEAHREVLAALFRKAACIALLRMPKLAHRPIDSNGRLFDEDAEEGEWRERVKRCSKGMEPDPSLSRLIASCLSEIEPEAGLALAQASLSLVPCDTARFWVAVCLPRNRARTATGILRRLTGQAHPSALEPHVYTKLASLACAQGRLHEARELYRTAYCLAPESLSGAFYVFNLSCFLGEPIEAIKAGEALSRCSPSDLDLSEARSVLRSWSQTRSETQLRIARDVHRCILGKIPPAAEALCEAYLS